MHIVHVNTRKYIVSIESDQPGPETVYFTGEGWSKDRAYAKVMSSAEAAEVMEEYGRSVECGETMITICVSADNRISDRDKVQEIGNS